MVGRKEGHDAMCADFNTIANSSQSDNHGPTNRKPPNGAHAPLLLPPPPLHLAHSHLLRRKHTHRRPRGLVGYRHSHAEPHSLQRSARRRSTHAGCFTESARLRATADVACLEADPSVDYGGGVVRS